MDARTFQDYAIAAASPSFVGDNSAENKIVLRGVLTGVVTRDGGSVVGLYVEHVPVGRRFDLDLWRYDIEGVEVLGGLQGTLFGEGSMGGTLRLVTERPDLDEFDAWLLASGSGTRKGGTYHEAAAGLNLPLAGGKFGRCGLAYGVDESGFADKETLDKKDDQTEASGFRVSAHHAPSDRFSISGSVVQQDTTVPGEAQHDSGLGDRQMDPFAGRPFLDVFRPSSGRPDDPRQLQLASD